MQKVFYVLSLVLLLVVFAFDLRTSHAQQTVPSVRDELALAVAKVAVNEAGWRSPADVAMIYQITEARGDTDERRLAWLTAHSSCVLTDRPLDDYEQRHGNCAWSRNLNVHDLEPAGWPQDLLWSNFVRRWQQVRRFAQMLVSGESRMRPCAETPRTWGSRTLDHERAIAMGLRQVDCGSTLNAGYVVVTRDPS